MLRAQEARRIAGGALARLRRRAYATWDKPPAYVEAQNEALSNPEQFWGRAAEEIAWFKAPTRVLSTHPVTGYGTWFPDAELNVCHNAVDRHVEAGRGEQAAFVHESPVTGTRATLTYAELQDQVSRFAGALADRGVAKGDRVIIYMPMTMEATVAMLACARLGAVHSVVFGGFAAAELSARINDAKPKAIVTSSCGIEPSHVVEYKPLLDHALELSTHKPTSCIVVQREQYTASLVSGRDITWDDAMAAAKPHDCVPVKSQDPLYIIYTSGTTGHPKGVVRDSGGYAVAMSWSMRNFYGMQPGDPWWAASDIGWVVGHSYIVYGPTINGNTSVVFEGKPVGTPDAGTYWRVVEENKIKALFTAPTALRAIRREDPKGEFVGRSDISSLERLYIAGERLDPPTLAWAQELFKRPVLDHWWQTETGWPMCGNCLPLGEVPVTPGSSSLPVPGYDVRCLREHDHAELGADELGLLAVKLPLPPGTMSGLYNDDARFHKSYLADLPGYYATGDAGFIDKNGCVHIMARTDDVINVAGHRLSTGVMEEAVASHPHIAECAVIGVEDDLKGEVPLALVVLSSHAYADHVSIDQVASEVVGIVREQVGPVAALKRCAVVRRLPKTRSGKVLRATMRELADTGKINKVPATIDDPTVLGEIQETLESIGLGAAKLRPPARD